MIFTRLRNIIFDRRQTATKKQLEQMRTEDTNFESMMEGNDSIFATNLQEPLVTPLTNPEAAAGEKSGQSAQAKPSNDTILVREKCTHCSFKKEQTNKSLEA